MKTTIYALLTARNVSFWQALIGFYQKAASSDFIRKVMETFATRIVQICLGLVTTVLVARILKPEGRGLFAVATTLGAIGIQFGNLGLQASNTYYVAKDRKILPELFANALIVSFVFGGLGSTLTWLFFAFRPDLAPLHGLLLILALSFIPFGLATLLLKNLLIGIYKIRSYNTIEIATSGINVFMIVLLIIINSVSTESVFGTGLIALIIGFAWTYWKLSTCIGKFHKPSIHLLKTNIGYGFKVYLTTLFAFMVSRIDLLMINYMLGETQAGYYSVAVSLANLLLVFPAVVHTISFPKLSSEVDPIKRWQFTVKTACGIGAFMVVACLGGLFFGKYAIILLFGKVFESAYVPFLIMSLGVLILSVEGIFRKYINTDPVKGYRNEIIYIWAGALPVNIGLNYILIPWMGINGAATASSISLFLVCSFAFNFVIKNKY
ncbi:MAG: hypothetical protein AYP45_08255 [Candidatus Brocadia carolinensis]|uniref:Uncharacterized protein n=1 Tax=Candidatus Brocadia carolinensis TaxID=1004156 RepID=A0A1V4AU20_9BACT|nr:MAG: hypothetical protein AYP45_08255 [Candidatus Brocadia caroliniensis]